MAVVAGEGVEKPTCEQTGLTVPECSCQGCLETMLREYRPALLAEEIKVTQLKGSSGEEPGTAEQRRAA